MADARIADRGYRPYDGPRLGVRGAVRTLAVHSALRALGLRRSFWAKLLPLVAVGIAYVPAIVFVGIAALLPRVITENTGIIPAYADYYAYITAAIVIVVALVAPEVLCTDRRDGMLGTYLASPLDRSTYLLAKVLAVVPVLALVTLGPPLLLLVGRTFADAGPEGLGDFALVLARIVAGGLAVSVAYTAVSLAAASLTDRRAVASAGIILFVLVTSIAVPVAVEEGGADEHFYLLHLLFVPFELTQRIFGAPGEVPTVGTVEVVAANVAWTVAAAAVVWLRYHRLQVTR